ncbi:ORF6N domain-containing protein [Fusobacterium necrophorum]|uniref:ORF6N domain-containing protein n=1 Tax=Fusobacterium necrophorum TaxID=859 RepID=UPI00101252F0|nr:ORF6N domain-containing protein [Fusobacterium necrophorum]RXZ28640.1 ORF6N domain-containing protein [Fusobacterium necrophorum]
MVEDKSIVIVQNRDIQNMIYSIRNKQVMLDSDLAMLYQVETKYLNRQRNRNEARFPEDFCFQLTKEEYEFLRCQNVTSKKESGSGGRRYMPYVFTEQGIAMLSTVLKSEVATNVSVNIMRAFVEMRKFLLSNQELFARLDRVELKQLETDKKLEEVFHYIATNTEVKQKIFFNGQIYDAFSFIVEIIRKASKEIILIDNYVDINTLNILSKKNNGINVNIYTSGKGNLTLKDINKFNAQYPTLNVKTSTDFHDRFLILDNTEVYHIGASIKDAGKKSFGITKIEDKDLIESLLKKIK